MSEKIDKHDYEQLKMMIQDKKPNEPVEEVLAVFCQRYGASIDSCRQIYKHLVEKGEIKEK